jgi:hypothetical protein
VKGQFDNNAFKPNEFATFNEMAKLEQNQGDGLPIFRRWLHYNKSCLYKLMVTKL